MSKQVIPFNKPFVVGKELFYIAQAVMNGGIAGDGHFTHRCHQWLEQNLGCAKALLTHSCTAALEMAAILANVGPGDEVIMPSFTFVSTANAFVLRGAVPVFVDICADSLNLDATQVEAAITPRTKAVVAVHYAGQPCDMEVLLQVCERHGLLLIEDAAQAILARDNARALGTIGHLGCLSFHETKNVISGEGGALLINDPSLIDRAEVIWQKGTNRKAFGRGEVDKYTWVDVGSSFLPSELTAAFLYAQLEQGEGINDHRRALYQAYHHQLESLEAKGCFSLPRTPGGKPANAHIFYLIMRSRDERAALIEFLREHHIHAVFHYVPLHDSPAGLRYGRCTADMSNTLRVSDCLVRLPLFSDMTETEVSRVCTMIECFFNQHAAA